MTQVPIEHALQIAIEHHRAGRLAEAEAIYRQILSVRPDHAETLNRLGAMAGQLGRFDVAIDLARKATAAAPDDPVCHFHLGTLFQNQSRLDEAITCYQRAVQLKRDYADAYNNLGNAWKDKGELDKAIACYQQAVTFNPDSAQTHYNFGNAMREKGRIDDAIACYENALRIKPDMVDARNNLGVAWYDKGQLDRAMDCYQQVLALDPKYAQSHYNLGNAMKDRGRLDDAIACYEKALAEKPGLVSAHNNLGVAFYGKGELDRAIGCYHRALAFDPGRAEAHNNLGNAWIAHGQPDRAIACFQRALALKGDWADALCNLGRAWKAIGRLDEACACHRRAIALDPKCVSAHDNLLTTLNYDPATDQQSLFAEQLRWNRMHAQPLRQFIQPHANDRNPERLLRVGYVSADFFDHASANFLLPLFRHHDGRQVDVFCYAQVASPDQITRQFRELVPNWRNTVGRSDAEVASLVRDDRIDILVDLKLHTADNRLLVFARRPAPVQVTWLGYPGTTGLDTIDYRLTDPCLDPPGLDDAFYSERSVRLSDTFWCYDPLTDEPPVNDLPCAQNGPVTFGCLNNFSKINNEVLGLWSGVLAAVPAARLLVLVPDDSARRMLLDRLAADGIEPARIECVARQFRLQYLQMYHRIDIAMDTFPYNGHTTSLDAFWMGVPVITLKGRTAVGRAGVSQLTNLGLAELIAHTPGQYVQIAADLAADRPRLAELRATLRQRMRASPLMDGARFARGVEDAYRTMWRTWCRK